ncbi:MAG: YfhO family protein [Oscillospiraceae bacterium]|nr:YfhO family protein [Oscillospiraceae bacterium]
MLNKSVDFKNLKRCVLLCAVLAFLTFIPFIVKDGGVFLVASDFNDQQIPFAISLHNNLLDGGIGGWAWDVDLGSSTLTSLGLSMIGTVFFWISMLFPARLYPWLVGWLFMLKYVAAGAAAYLYLSLFLRDRRYAAAAAVLYAFSGFSSINVVYFLFHDVIAAFPLLLYALERTMDDRRCAWMLVLTMALCALIDCFFFVMECVFLVLYFVFRFWTWDLRKLFGRALLCLGCGLLGMGLSALVLLPSVLDLLSNPRAGTNLLNIDALVYETRDFLDIVKGIFLPAEAMDDMNSIYHGRWLSTACWLPLVGMSFVFAYLRGRRDWLSRLMWAMLIISFSPLLTCSFLLFRGTYQRWWYMMVLIMALITALVAEEREQFDLRFGLRVNAAIVLVFCFLLLFLPSYEVEGSMVFHRVRFLANILIALGGLGYIALYPQLSEGKRPDYIRWLIWGVSAAAVLTTASTIYCYQHSTKDAAYYMGLYEMGGQLELPDEQYRLNASDNKLLMTGQSAGIGSYISTPCSSIRSFDLMFDWYHNVYSLNRTMIPGLQELLGAKYRVHTEDPGDRPVVQTVSARGTTLWVTEAEACPIGFEADSYLLYDELMTLPAGQRGIALLDSIVVDREDEALVSALLPHKSPAELELDRASADYAAECRARAVSDFSRDGHGLRCTISAEKDGVWYFSVPFDQGWTALLDGAEVPILSSGYMIAVPVGAGVHSFELRYCTPGLQLGGWISLASLALLGGLLFLRRRRHG